MVSLGSTSLVSWCFGGVSVASRWCFGGLSVVPSWCLNGVGGPFVFFGGALLVCRQWCLGCVFVGSWRCVCGVLRCLRDVLVYLRQSKLAISLAILMSRWWCLCVVLVVSPCMAHALLMVSRWCLHGVQVVVSRWNFSACRSNLEGVVQL